MAKMLRTSKEQAKKDMYALIQRTESYAESVRVQFARCVNDILALHKTLPVLGDGEMYSFDGANLRIQKKVEELLRRLAATATLAVEQGIETEWDKANESADALLESCFGKAALSDVHFSAWRKRNKDAMKSFMQRADAGGFNLSDRIWKSTRQLREEMEVAMTLSIGEGESASQMSRKVRQYLQDPDLMFRRFRYKVGEKVVTDYDEKGNPVGSHTEPVYGRKWKKKVKDVDGRTKWIDYDKDDYKVGRGYYKSSARNAMRVARTETNMAYRTADQTRWKQMDFVLGMHIELSHSHPCKDICDTLAGDYPKDFKFEGWHPQCFCVMTPILMDEDEMAKITDAFINGDEYTPQGRMITTYPKAFKDWATDHRKQLQEAHDHGKDPYFARHNWSIIQDLWKNPKAATITAHEKKVMDDGTQMVNKLNGTGIDASRLKDALSHKQCTEVERLTNQLQQQYQAESAIRIQAVSDSYKKFTKHYAAGNCDSLDDLANKIQVEKDGFEAEKLFDRFRHEAARYTQNELEKHTTCVDGLRFTGVHRDYVIVKAKTLTANRKDIKMDAYIADLVGYEDSNGRKFFYEVFTDSGNYRYSAKTASESLAKLPKGFTEHLDGFIGCLDYHPLDTYYKKVYTKFGHGYMYSSNPITIHSIASNDWFVTSITHELGHHLDIRLNRISMSAEWADAVKKDNAHYSNYAKNSLSEDFAETIKAYFHDHQIGEKMMPNRFKILDRIVSNL